MIEPVGNTSETVCPLFNAPLVRQSCSSRYSQEWFQSTMALPDSLHNAVKGLTSALDLLEAAVDRRAQAEAARADRDQEMALMQEDRARIGEELERSELSNELLRAAGAELGNRLARMDALCITLQQGLSE